jgi:hypothetical protein
LPNVWNLIASFKHWPENRWYIFSILTLNIIRKTLFCNFNLQFKLIVDDFHN